MPSNHVRKLGPERLRIPQPRSAVLFARTGPFIYAIFMAGLLYILPRKPGVEHGSGTQWFVLLQFVVMVPVAWRVSRFPILAIHEREIVFSYGRQTPMLRWNEARVEFAKSVSGRLLIRPNCGAAARSIIAVDIPPEWVDAVAEALPKSEVPADAPILPTQPRAMT